MPEPTEAERRHEVTTYFDTPDHVLARVGMSLRVRAADDRHVQTLKANRLESIVADRAEWEWPVEHDAPDLRLIEQAPTTPELPAGLNLEPVFSTEIDRTTTTLDLDGGAALVEAAYDEGTIRAGEKQQPVRELELELRKGDPAPLYRLALELHAAAPLTLENESKAARGYRLKTGAKPAARKAEAVPLGRHASAAQAFQQILSTQLGHLLSNQAAALAGDAEGVHQMRVAIRRIRAALALFQPYLEPHAESLFRAALRRVGRVFGEARDWDVFCLQVVPSALQAPRDAVWRDVLLEPAAAARAAAYADFCREVRGPAFTGLVLGLAAWAAEKRLLHGSAQKPIEDLCPDLLDRLARKVERRGRHIEHSDTERHALRKSLKKLRYAIGFVRPLYRSNAIKSYLHDCKKLQQTLGDLNDTVAATGLANRLVGETRIDLAPAVGVLAEQLERRRNDALGDLAKRWKSFRDRPHFWE